MKLGDTTIIRTFDEFYLPDIKGADWTAVLYNYLAAEYEEISDWELKHHVIDHLFRNVVGLERLESDDALRILDIGCGTGFAQLWKPEGVTLFGIDISPEMIGGARRRGEEVMVGNIATMSVAEIPGKFAGAIMSFVDYWLTPAERLAAYTTIARILPSGARLAFNLHLPPPNWKQAYPEMLRFAGFSDIVCLDLTVMTRDGEKNVPVVVALKYFS